MKKDSALDLLFKIAVHQMYDAEREILHNLGELAENASQESLGNVLLQHREETKQHIERLQQVMQRTHIDLEKSSMYSWEELVAKSKELIQAIVNLDFTSGNKTLRGIIKEGHALLSKFASTDAADMVVLGISQQIEHFEIASYNFLCALALATGEKEAYELMRRSLEEEIAMEKRLLEVTANKQAATS